jgi:carbonic anhydrase/acetyltransferase-like protein (isoleucine patch superfamily)
MGANCMIMEQAVIGGTPDFHARLYDALLVGPHTYLTGCIVEKSVFLATGTTVFNGAHIGKYSRLVQRISLRLACASIVGRTRLDLVGRTTK